MSISDKITQIANLIASAYDAVDDKGGTLPQSEDLTNLIAAIMSIPSGTDTSDATALASDIVSSKTAYIATGKVDGTFAPQVKSATPSTSAQDVTPDSGKWLSKVTVGAIPSQYIVPTGTKSISSNGTHDVTNYASVSVNVTSATGLDSFTHRASGDLTSSSALGSFSFSVGFKPKIFIMFHNGGISKPSSGTTIIAMAKIADANRGNYGWGATLNSSGNTYHLYENASSTSYKAGLNFTSTGVSGWEDSSYALNFSGKYRYVAYG